MGSGVLLDCRLVERGRRPARVDYSRIEGTEFDDNLVGYGDCTRWLNKRRNVNGMEWNGMGTVGSGNMRC